VERLARKLETARGMLPKPAAEDRPGATAGLLAFGTSHYGTTEGRDRLEREHGLALDYLRLRALPLATEAKAWIDRHGVVYVVEQNRDAQLAALLRDELPALADRFVPVLQYDGLPLDATTVVDGVLSHRGRTGGDR
jgi:2-oxoglutarate ferredoxin oxidoreductase subunit alpha